MQRSLATRLEKLERRYKPEDGCFFLVWGSDQASVDAGLDDARTAGKIVDGDIVVTGVWPAEAGPQPPTRWVLHFNGKSQLSEDERDILCDIAQDRARIGPAETDRTVVMSVCRGHKHAATDYSNEELFGIALGRQLCST